MAPSTHLAYQQGLKALDEFCSANVIHYSWPLDGNLLNHFVAHLSLQKKSLSTAKTYLAGISTKHKLNGWEDPTESFMVKKLLKGFAQSTRQKDTRCPVTYQRLLKLIPILNNICTKSYEALLFTAAFTTAFFGFFRISELIGQSNKAQGFRKGLVVSDLQFATNHLTIRLAGSKTDQLKKGEIITLSRVAKDEAVCPVTAMKKLVDSRPKVSN